MFISRNVFYCVICQRSFAHSNKNTYLPRHLKRRKLDSHWKFPSNTCPIQKSSVSHNNFSCRVCRPCPAQLLWKQPHKRTLQDSKCNKSKFPERTRAKKNCSLIISSLIWVYDKTKRFAKISHANFVQPYKIHYWNSTGQTAFQRF